MKKRALEIVNVFLLLLLTSIDVLLMVKLGLSNSGWLLIGLVLVCFSTYLGGRIFPHYTVSLLYKLSKVIYRDSDNVSIPTRDEASKALKSRLPYLLVVVNILMLLLMLTFLETPFCILLLRARY